MIQNKKITEKINFFERNFEFALDNFYLLFYNIDTEVVKSGVKWCKNARVLPAVVKIALPRTENEEKYTKRRQSDVFGRV